MRSTSATLALAALLALAVIVQARPQFRPHLGQHGLRPAGRPNGELQSGEFEHEYHHVAADGRYSHLKFKGEFSENGVVSLDDDLRLDAVVCEQDERTVIVTTTGSVAASEIAYPVGSILAGGPEWGCLHEDGSKVVLRRVESLTAVSGHSLVLTTTRVTYHQVYKHLDMSYEGNQYPPSPSSDGYEPEQQQLPVPARRLDWSDDVEDGVDDLGKDAEDGVDDIGHAAYDAGSGVYNGIKTAVTGSDSYQNSQQLASVQWSSSYPEDIQGSGWDVKASLAGSATADLAVAVKLSVRDYELQLASVQLEGSADVQVTGDVSAQAQASSSGSKQVYTVSLPDITLAAPVPMLVSTSVPIMMGYSVSVSGGVDMKVAMSARGGVSYGLEYTPEQGVSWLHRNSMQHSFTPPSEGYSVSARAQVYVQPTLAVTVDCIATLNVNLKPSVTLNADVSSSSGACEADEVDVSAGWGVGVSLSGSVGVDVLGYKFLTHNFGPDSLDQLSGSLYQNCFALGGGGGSASPSQSSSDDDDYSSSSSSSSSSTASQSGYSAGSQPASQSNDGDDDYYSERRLTAAAVTSSSTSDPARPVATAHTEVAGPKRCASSCQVASGLSTCSWLNGKSICSALSHAQLLELDASLLQSEQRFKEHGPACGDAMLPYLCSVAMPLCGAESSTAATSQPEIMAVPMTNCSSAYKACGLSNSTAGALCGACAYNRYCPVASSPQHKLTPAAQAKPATGNCLAAEASDVRFCSHKAGRGVYLRSELYSSLRAADATAKAIVGNATSSVSRCLKAAKLLACDMLLPDCSADSKPAPMCMDTCVQALASCSPIGAAQAWCSEYVLGSGYATTSPTCGMKHFSLAAVSVGEGPSPSTSAPAAFSFVSAAAGAAVLALVAIVVALIVVAARSRSSRRSPTELLTVNPLAQVSQ